jgi:hypothetical protein
MSKSPNRKPKGRAATRPAPDPKVVLPKLRARLDKERASLARWRQRLFRAAHAYERQHRLTTRLERRIAKLQSA